MAIQPVGLFEAFLMLTLITFWGSSFVVVKITLKEGLTPIAIATFRFLIAGGLFVIALLIEKNRKRNYRLLVERKDVPTLLFLALSGITFLFIAQYTGIELAGASMAAILVTLLSPIIITILSTKIFKEKLNKKQIFGIGTAVIGTLIVTVGGTLSLQFNKDFFLGSLILLSTPVLWSAYSLMGKKILEKYDPFLVVAYVTILGGLLLIPFSLAENSLHQILTMSLNSWLAIIYLSFTCSLLGYYIWFYAIKQVGAAVTSSFLFAEPLVTVLLAVTLIQEKLTLPIIAGGLLIFTGVYLITKKQTIKNQTRN
jgi:drug/metabolite transporter (DMT)-like permease